MEALTVVLGVGNMVLHKLALVFSSNVLSFLCSLLLSVMGDLLGGLSFDEYEGVREQGRAELGFILHNTEIMVLCLAASSSVVLSHSLSLRLVWPSAPPPPPPSLLPLLSHPHHDTSNPTHLRFPRQLKPHPLLSPSHICHAGEYVFPDPIPEFADAETEKFRLHLLKKLSKKDVFGDSLDDVLLICTQIMSTFLHTEYGGPGTLLVIPFIDMADTINERGLPGGPQAARAAVVWAQKHVDKDWDIWKGTQKSADDE